jgi:uncharacterized protein YyaL (SSP411 family)
MTISQDTVNRIIADSIGNYDPQNGGFGAAPKFPQETLLELLLDHLAHNPDERKLDMVTHTLDAMAFGGIRDQLGGGFHRYSTDAEWLVPHFEIMLYDNAMLGRIYVEAFRQTERQRYAQIARGIFDFVLREMTSPDGAFYTAFDAEVDAREGLTYLWTADEVRAALIRGPFSDENVELFLEVYGLDRGPNFADPHHGDGTPSANVLHLADVSLADENDALIDRMRLHLYNERLQRKQPSLDTKIITSWNALMIRALAHGGKILQEERYLEAARKAANFLLTNHRTAEERLKRTSRDGRARYDGFLDDHAVLAQALLALYEADGREAWKEAAAAIATDMIMRFEDDTNGGFFFTPNDATDLPVRQKIAGDSPLPSGNAVAAMVMQGLGHLETAHDTIAAFGVQIDQIGEGLSSLVLAAARYIRQAGSIEVTPADGARLDVGNPVQSAGNAVSLSMTWTNPTTLSVHVAIAQGYHINAHEPLKGSLATQLSVVGENITVDAIDYPAAKLERFAFATELMPVYSGEVTLTVHFNEPPTHPFKVALQYQACDDSACLSPTTKSASVAPPEA